jgi:hypothetical protein
MAHWPKTVRGNVLTFLLIVVAAPVVVWLAIALSGPVVWASVAVLAAIPILIYTWRRRAESARRRAYVGAFTFGDAVRRLRTKERADALIEVKRRAELLGAR